MPVTRKDPVSAASAVTGACRSVLATLAVAITVVWAAEAAVAEERLFTVAASDVAGTLSGPRKGEVRTGLLQLDTGSLAIVLGERTAPAGGSTRAPATGPREPVILPLFADTELVVDDADVESGFEGDPVLTGTIGDDGFVVLVVEEGEVTGQIYDGAGNSYRIEPVGGTLHRVIEVDTATDLDDIVVEPPRRSQRAPNDDRTVARPADDRDGDQTIRILVAYTDRASKQSPRIRSDIELAIRLANKSFSRGAGIKLKLVGTHNVKKYNEKKRIYSQVLSDLTLGLGNFKTVHTLRNQRKADLVALLRADDPNTCGIAWLIQNPEQWDAQYGFSVTSVGCIANYAFSHEIGHNLGLRHDRYVYDNTSKNEYNFGYVNMKARLITIMAYANKCSERELYCGRIPYFSDDRQKYRGDKLGIKKGKPGAADANRTLLENRNVVSGFR